jgi:hypothetical protein
MTGFMMSPIGLVIVLAYSAVILLAARLMSRAMGKFRARWLLLLPPAAVLLALPWAEEAWITWHFNEACADAGVKVYRQVEVKGYCDDRKKYERKNVRTGALFLADPTKQADFEADGYRYLEDLLKDGGVRHLERNAGQIVVSIQDRPSCRYRVQNTYHPDSLSHEEPIGWKLEKLERQVVDSQTGELLGRDLRINRGLPIHELLWVRYLGPAMKSCPTNAQPAFPQSILKPVGN